MFTEGIIIACITGAITLIGVVISNNAHDAVTDEKIAELTREVRKHNGFAEKIPVMEAEERRLNERIKVLENRAS